MSNVKYLEDSTNHTESIKNICLVNHSHKVWDENINFKNYILE